MRSLYRVLLEMKTRRFVDQMIHKYTDIRLSATTRAMPRKRPRAEATGVRKPPVNRDHDHGDQAERSTSSYCRTESDRSSRLSSSTMLDIGRSQFGKGHEYQQQQQEEAQLDRWRMSEAPTVSECSAFSSTRLTRLHEEDDGGYDNQENQEVSPHRSDSKSAEHETEENQDHSSSSEGETSSINIESTTSTQLSVENQSDDQSDHSQCSIESPPTSSTSETLPRLRPTAPAHCVVPNCCDYFTSPHPHYPKEVIGKAQKVDESPQVDSLPSNSSSSDSTNEAERGDQSVDLSADRANDSSRGGQDGDEFEMWDYVCPQYARRGYANEWI